MNKMDYSYIYIVYDNGNIFAIYDVRDEADALCSALSNSSINNYKRGGVHDNGNHGFYVEEIKISKNGICIGKKNCTDIQTIVNENKQTNDCINITDCIKIPKTDTYDTPVIENVSIDETGDDSADDTSILEDMFDEAYGLKKKTDQKTNDPEYLKRCEEQKKRKDRDIDLERISVFRSGKSTYVKIKTKINKETMRIIDISSLFADKYLIYDFMENKKLINLTSNSEDAQEYYIFRQLELLIESYWWEINNSCPKMKKNTDHCIPDPSHSMDPKYADLFDEFYVFMDEKGGVPKLEKDMHQHLNMNSENNIFERDFSSDNYE